MPERRPSEVRALKAAMSASPACASIEELSAWSDGRLDTRRAEAIERHLASCRRCQAELELLQRFESAATRREEEADLAWIAARLQHVPRAAEKARWKDLFALGWMRGFVLAAACLLVVIAAALHRRSEATFTPPAAGPQAVRSREISPRFPAGDLAQVPRELRWEAVRGAAHYQALVLDVEKTVLWSGQTVSSSVALPQSLAAWLLPGRTLLWQVAAFDAPGHRLAESAMVPFRVSASGGAR